MLCSCNLWEKSFKEFQISSDFVGWKVIGKLSPNSMLNDCGSTSFFPFELLLSFHWNFGSKWLVWP